MPERSRSRAGEPQAERRTPARRRGQEDLAKARPAVAFRAADLVAGRTGLGASRTRSRRLERLSREARARERRARDRGRGLASAGPSPLDANDRDPTFHEFATLWLDEKEADLERSTYDDYLNLLTNHLLPAFHDKRLSEIDYEAIRAYRTARLREGAQTQARE